MNSNEPVIGDYLYIKGRIGWKGLKKEEYLESSDYRIINAESIVDGHIDWKKAGYISKERYDESPEIMLKEGDILISKDGTIGKVGFVDILTQPSTVASGIFVVRNINPELVDTRYLYHFFRSQLFSDFIESRTEGSVIPHLYQADFESMPLSLLNLSDQKKISFFLDVLESLINNLTKQNDNLLTIANQLYNQYFPYVIDDDLPNGWHEGKLGDIIEFHDSKRIPLSGKERSERAKIFPYYGAASITDYVDDYLFDGIYLLLGEDGSVVTDAGEPVLQYVFGKFWVNNHAHILTGKNGYSVESLYLLCQRLNIEAIITGAVQPKVSQANLKSIEIIIPPDFLITEFSNRVDTLFILYRNNVLQCEKLISFRDQILTKLMSGEIDVSILEAPN